MSLIFAPHLDVLPVDGRGLVTIGESGVDAFSGPEFAALAALIDGTRGEAEIVAAADDSEAVGRALRELTRHQVLLERHAKAATAGSNGQAAWWSSQVIAPDAAAERLRSASVDVRPVGDLDPKPLLSAIDAAGIRRDQNEPDLTIVVSDDYLDERLAEWNREALEAERTWMLARPRTARVLVGPVFWPEHGPCWECLAERLRHRQGIERRARWLAGDSGSQPPLPGPPTQAWLGAALVVTEALKWLSGQRPELESSLLSFDPRTWDTGRHRVVWRPQCRACGAGEAPTERPAVPVRIRARRDTAPRRASGLRGTDPRTTLQRFEHHVGQLTGAVDVLRRAPGPDHLHAYVSGGPIARIHGEQRGWEPIAEQLAAGKGTSDVEARAGALGEALERYSGGFFGDEPRRTARIEELGDAAVAPNDYMRFSERQFEERETWNRRSASRRTFVPEPFDPRLPIEWSPVWSLTGERERFLPTALCYYGARVLGAPFCVAESNGNAAGNSLEEAILHGVLELVERDHVALWWYNRLPAPGVDLDTLDDPWFERLRAGIAAEGRDLWALDLTADLGIPAAAALVAAPDGTRVGMGFGAHLDLRSAVIRAFTELAQLGLGAPSGGLGGGVDPTLRLDDHAFARPDPGVPPRPLSSAAAFTGDVVQALELCREAIEGQGLELLVLDQTRPDIGLPVVKAIVPGLRHFWPRFGPGRLYDVPVALGRLECPRQESELNPTPPVP